MIIYDLGCLGQPDLLPKIFTAIPGVAATFALAAGLAAVGALVNRSPCFQACDLFTGWGVVAAVMTLSAVLFEKSLPFAAMALFALIFIAVIPTLKRRYFSAPFWLLLIVPGFFILAAINIAGVAKWDDFSQWVPNAFYLFHYDDVPRHGLPAAHSMLPGYPYALPFLTYLSSWLANGFLVQGGAMINFVLLIAFSAMLTETAPDANAMSLHNFGKLALALVVVTILNPAFNASFTVTNQADTGTMVLTGALGILLLRTLGDKRHMALMPAIALIAVALTLLKQSNLVLVVLLLVAFLIVAAKNRALKPALMQALIAFIPSLAMRMIWQHFVNTEMDGSEVLLRPISAWRFDLLGPLLHSVMDEMIKKNGLTLLMFAVTGYGIWGLFRPATPLRNQALLAGIVYVGYVAFLVMIYIASFTEPEIRRAASLYRYTAHVGLLGLPVVWNAAPVLWDRFKSKPVLSRKLYAAGTAVLILLLPAVILMGGDVIVPHPTRDTCAIRNFGQELADALPDHAGVAIIEPESEALFTYMINFELDLQSLHTEKNFDLKWHISRAQDTHMSEVFDSRKMPKYMRQIDHDAGITTIIFPQAIHDPITIGAYDNHASPLVLERTETGWQPLMP